MSHASSVDTLNTDGVGTPLSDTFAKSNDSVTARRLRKVKGTRASTPTSIRMTNKEQSRRSYLLGHSWATKTPRSWHGESELSRSLGWSGRGGRWGRQEDKPGRGHHQRYYFCRWRGRSAHQGSSEWAMTLPLGSTRHIYIVGIAHERYIGKRNRDLVSVHSADCFLFLRSTASSLG